MIFVSLLLSVFGVLIAVAGGGDGGVCVIQFGQDPAIAVRYPKL